MVFLGRVEQDRDSALQDVSKLRSVPWSLCPTPLDGTKRFVFFPFIHKASRVEKLTVASLHMYFSSYTSEGWFVLKASGTLSMTSVVRHHFASGAQVSNVLPQVRYIKPNVLHFARSTSHMKVTTPSSRAYRGVRVPSVKGEEVLQRQDELVCKLVPYTSILNVSYLF